MANGEHIHGLKRSLDRLRELHAQEQAERQHETEQEQARLEQLRAAPGLATGPAADASQPRSELIPSGSSSSS